MLALVLFIVRIAIVVYCINKAKELNRNPVGWALFAFFIPIIALIWIQFTKPIIEYQPSEIDDIGVDQDE